MYSVSSKVRRVSPVQASWIKLLDILAPVFVHAVAASVFIPSGGALHSTSLMKSSDRSLQCQSGRLAGKIPTEVGRKRITKKLGNSL